MTEQWTPRRAHAVESPADLPPALADAQAGQRFGTFSGEQVRQLFEAMHAAIRDGDNTTLAKVMTLVSEMKDRLDAIQDHTEFDRRVESLRTARQHILELSERKNERGYSDYKLSVPQQIEEELKVAAWLRGGGE